MSDKCSRTVCEHTTLTHRHTQTDRLYCARCAKGINEYNPGLLVLTELWERVKRGELTLWEARKRGKIDHDTDRSRNH